MGGGEEGGDWGMGASQLLAVSCRQSGMLEEQAWRRQHRRASAAPRQGATARQHLPSPRAGACALAPPPTHPHPSGPARPPLSATFASAQLPAPMMGVSPMRPAHLPQRPPVLVAAARRPIASLATAPTVCAASPSAAASGGGAVPGGAALAAAPAAAALGGSAGARCCTMSSYLPVGRYGRKAVSWQSDTTLSTSLCRVDNGRLLGC